MTGATEEPGPVRAVLIVAALAVLAVFLLLPLLVVFTEALRRGWEVAWAAITDPDALAAIRLTLLVAAVVVPINTVCGTAAAWAIAKFDFPGRTALVIAQQAFLQPAGGLPRELLCEASIRVGWVQASTLKPARIPPAILEKLSP